MQEKTGRDWDKAVEWRSGEDDYDDN